MSLPQCFTGVLQNIISLLLNKLIEPTNQKSAVALYTLNWTAHCNLDNCVFFLVTLILMMSRCSVSLVTYNWVLYNKEHYYCQYYLVKQTIAHWLIDKQKLNISGLQTSDHLKARFWYIDFKSDCIFGINFPTN